MRLMTKHVDQLAKDVAALQQGGCSTLIRACKAWSDAVKYGYDQDTVAYRREGLEKELRDFKLEIGAIYDLMGQHGMLVRDGS